MYFFIEKMLNIRENTMLLSNLNSTLLPVSVHLSTKHGAVVAFSGTIWGSSNVVTLFLFFFALLALVH